MRTDHLRRMRHAGKAAAGTLALVARELRAGLTTADIDRLVRADTARRGGRPSQLGFHGFPAAVCTSRNHVVCHGIPSADEVLAAEAGCSVVEVFGGHGIGRQMHQPPFVSHTRARAQDVVLRVGMAFTVEPMINLGGPEVDVLADGWTVVTRDGSLSAQFEHTVIVTEEGVEVLTEA